MPNPIQQEIQNISLLDNSHSTVDMSILLNETKDNEII